MDMKLKNNTKNRLGIFVFFDKEGIVDDYVTYLLDDLSKHLKDLVIVCNGKITSNGKKKLEKYSDQIFVRSNIGFDVSAWKEVILEKLDKRFLQSFDEVLLFNDTFYGPLYPFAEVFKAMNEEDIDLWGLTAHAEACPYVSHNETIDIPKFIQSYFYAFRQSIVKSDDFYEYWESIPEAEEITYDDAVHIHENRFANFFEERGYKFSAYIDNDDLSSDPLTSICYNTFMPYGMVAERKLPIIRRKVFNFDYDQVINYNGAEEIRNVLEYVKENTKYPVKMIWDNLLRLYNISDLKSNLHLNFIPDERHSNFVVPKSSTAVFVHLYYTDILNQCYDYLKNIPDTVDLYISTGSEEKKRIIEDYFKDLNVKKVIVIENRGRDLASLLVGFRKTILKYKYFCFIHDKKTSGGKGPLTIGRSFQYIEFENLLKSEKYINNIIELFESDESLGVLSPPGPLHNIYFGSIGEEWTSCFKETKKLLKRFDVKVPLDEEKTPFCLATCFWARTDALEKLLKYEWKYEDFPKEPLPVDGTISHALERSLAYFAQDKLYYSGWVLSSHYASLEIANLNRMFSEVVRIQQEKMPLDLAYSFGDFKNRLRMLEYPKHYRKRYNRKVNPTYFGAFMNLKEEYGCRYAIKYSIKYVINKLFRKK